MSDEQAKTLCILGRQPSLGLAELESLYGAEHLKPISHGALLDIEADQVNFKRLGGTIKVAKLLHVLPSPHWHDIFKYLAKNIPLHLKDLPEGGFTLGVSVYGLDINVSMLNADLLSLKKIIRSSGRSVRIVPNKTLELNSAQVLHNKLTRRGAWELVLVADGNKTYIAQTFFVQDIDDYAARDQARPKRDSHVGMLPPKLAQIIINLGAGSSFDHQSGVTLLDPFVGTGVVLQEALLMGYSVVGSDLEPRMVKYAQENIDWLAEKYQIDKSKYQIIEGDATNIKWAAEPNFIASELYLGRPLNTEPSPQVLKEIIQDVNTITKKFLNNIATQIPSGTRLSLAFPAWRIQKGISHLPTLENLTSLGYNRVSFVHADNKDLIYFREDQIVARELVVLKKI